MKKHFRKKSDFLKNGQYLSDFTQIYLFFLGVARIHKSFISTSSEIRESYLWLRNIEFIVAYIKVPVPGVPYLNSKQAITVTTSNNQNGLSTVICPGFI